MSNLLTQAQVFTLAFNNGFTATQAEIMAAISMAESLTMVSGRQYANFDLVGDLNLVDEIWGPSFGGWQVRSKKAEYGKGTTRDALRLPDPAFNAQAARKIWLDAYNAAGQVQSAGYKPWSTFKNGAYLGYMQTAVYNPRPQIPAGSYLVTGGDSLSRIGIKTGFAWREIAAVNRIVSPYTIFPGQVLLLPEFPYTVVSGDNLTTIAATVGTNITWYDLWQNNLETVPNPNIISVGQVLQVPRLVG